MNREQVSSSSIISIGYDKLESNLEIEFVSSRIYRCFEVPKEEAMALINADSIGSYFAMEIRDAYVCVPLVTTD